MHIFKNFIFFSVSIIFFNACNSSDEKVSYRNVITSKVFNDSLLTYTTVSDVVKVENIKTGKILFADKLIDENWSQPILDNRNNIYYSLDSDDFICVNIKTRKKIWRTKTDGQAREFKFVNDSVIVSSIRGFGIKALNSKTGKILYEIRDVNDNNPCLATTWVYYFTFDENNFYANDLNCSNVIAYRSTDGKKIWNFKSDLEGVSIAYAFKNYVFCGITDDPTNKVGEIYLLDSKNGNVKFSKKTPFDLFVQPILYKDTIVYYTSDLKLWLLDLATMHSDVIYEFKENEGVFSKLFLIGDSVYFGDIGYHINKLNLKTKVKERVGNAPRGLSDVYRVDGKIKFVY